jgi:hypothetical protein
MDTCSIKITYLLVQVLPAPLQLSQVLALERALLLRTCQLSIGRINAAVDISLLHPAATLDNPAYIMLT